MIPQPPFHETINDLLYGILQSIEGNPLPMNIPRPPYYNVTNDLLYAILNALNSNGGGQTVYNQFRVYYVSARYGDDTTGEANNIQKPFLTIAAARQLYFIGDIIHVLEGNYDEGDLFGNYTYWFDYGAEVSYSGDGAIFQNNTGLCIVRGFGKFNCTGNGNAVNVGNWEYAFLDMECESIDTLNDAVIFWQNSLLSNQLTVPNKLKANRIYSNFGAAVTFRTNSYAIAEAKDIQSDSTTVATIVVGDANTGTIKNSNITCSNYTSAIHFTGTAQNMSFEDCRILCRNPITTYAIFVDGMISDLYLSATDITANGADSLSILAQANFNLHLDNNVTANSDTGGEGVITYVNGGSKIHLTSNNDITIDITGSSGFYLARYQNAEIIRLTSSNASETLNEIDFAPKHHSFRLLPAAGLTLQIVSGDPANAGDSDIILESATITLNGSKGDWIELRNGLYGTGSRQVSASNY